MALRSENTFALPLCAARRGSRYGLVKQHIIPMSPMCSRHMVRSYKMRTRTQLIVPTGGYPKFVSQGLNEKYLPVWLQSAGYNTYYTGKLFNAHSVDTYDSPFAAGWTGSVRWSSHQGMYF